jgi:hypothetical protein
MLKHTREETKTYKFTRKQFCKMQKEQGLKKGYYRYPGESYLRITQTSLYTPRSKDIQKNIYKIGKTEGLASLSVRGKSTQIPAQRMLKIFCTRSTLITE